MIGRLVGQFSRSECRGNLLAAAAISHLSPESSVHSLTPKAGFRHGRAPLLKQPRLLIFDKDGTLICFHSLWVPWLRQFVAQVDQASRLGISPKLFRALGFCPVQKKVKRGLLAEGTIGQIKERVAQMLVHHGLDRGQASEIVDGAVRSTSAQRAANSVQQLCDLEALFLDLKGRGIKIAICTADSRTSTLRTLEALGVDALVDLVVCGDDRHSKPKPDPGNALFICRQLGVQPAETMVIGDTPADLGMGRSAKLGSTVGVLSGVGSPGDLEPEADHLVSRRGQEMEGFIGQLVRLIG